ncbi:MAG: Bro-N domain-containing protein, partial [Planctomycetota bacterium]
MSEQAMCLSSQFEGHEIATYRSNKGEPIWPAREIGRAIGYGNEGGNLVRSISGAWAEEFEGSVIRQDLDGSDSEPASGVATQKPAGHGGSRVEAIFLTERGVWTAAMLSKKPAGRRLRRWLAAEILPRLARGELVEAPVSQAQVEVLERRMERLEARTEHTERKTSGRNVWANSWQDLIRQAVEPLVRGKTEDLRLTQLLKPIAAALGVLEAKISTRRVAHALLDLGWTSHRSRNDRFWISPIYVKSIE